MTGGSLAAWSRRYFGVFARHGRSMALASYDGSVRVLGTSAGGRTVVPVVGHLPRRVERPSLCPWPIGLPPDEELMDAEEQYHEDRPRDPRPLG